MRQILPILCLVGALGIARVSFASDEVPGAPQAHDVLLSGGTVHPVSGPEARADVLLSKGKIVAIGSNLDATADTVRIDITGKHVYPSLFDASSDIGLVEIGSIRATQDETETGAINPNARAEVAVNPDSELIPVARANGVLLALSAPTGNAIPGSSAVLMLDGWTWEQMTLKAPAALHVRWPSMSPRRAWWMRENEREQAKQRDEAVKQITQAFADARAYMTAKSKAPTTQPQEFDARWEAMIPVLEGKVPVAVHADEIQQIEAAIAFAQQEKVKLIIVGGFDAPLCADLLKKYDVPVVVDGVQRLPQRRGSGYDDAFTVPERLRTAGIRFCLSGERSASNMRNLPYHAASAAAYGLPKEEALKAITLYPAQIFGVADRVGSIDVGKDATIIVTDGDPLQTTTHVERAYIQGRAVDLSNRQTRLWEKYKEKYRREGVDVGAPAAAQQGTSESKQGG